MALDDVVEKESIGKKLKKGLSYGFEGGKAYLATKIGVALVGADAALSGGAFALGAAIVKKLRKKSINLKDMLQEYTKGTIMGTLGSAMYSGLEVIPNVDVAGNIDWAGTATRAGLMVGPGNMAFNAAYFPVDRLVRNDYNPAHIIDDWKNKYWDLNKKSWKWLSAPLGLTANGYLGGYPGMIGVDTAYRVIAEGKETPKAA